MKESKSGMSRCPAEIERRARAVKGGRESACVEGVGGMVVMACA